MSNEKTSGKSSHAKTIAAIAIIAVIGIAFLCSRSVDELTAQQTETPQGTQASNQSLKRSTESKIAAAKEELNKIKERKKENGEDEELNLLDAIKPEVVLPPVLALVSDELKEYDIESEILAEQIKSNPSQFRKKVPEHLRIRFLLLSPEDEKKIGDKTAEELSASGKIYRDETEMKRVQAIVTRIVAQLPCQVPVNIFLYKDDSINAFCLLNGSVYIHSGLLNNVESDDMLAFVIAHEYAHLAAQHVNESLTNQLLFLAGDVIAEDKENKLEKDGKMLEGVVLRTGYLGGGYAGVYLPFERRMESEADTLGIRYMARAGYDPQAAVDFFKALQENSPESPGWIRFLSDHPTDAKRIESMEKECENLKKGKNLKPPLLDRALKATKKKD